jgi:hypothetical protein
VLEVLGPSATEGSARALVQSSSTEVLCEVLAEVDFAPARARGRLRIDVDPLRV